MLTREGILVVRDDLQPGKSVNGFLVGSLWHREKNGISGDNWFEQPPVNAYPALESGGEPARMSLLIHHAKGEGRTFGAEGMSVFELPAVVKAVQEGRPAPGSVTFSKQRIAAGQPVTFVTVLVPFSPSGSAGQIAEGISSSIRDGAASVRVDAHAAGRESVRVEIAGDGKWSVRR